MRNQFAKQQAVDPLVIDPYFKQVIYVNNINDDSVISNFGYDTYTISQSSLTPPQRQTYAAKWGTAGIDHVSGSGTAITQSNLLLNTSGATNYAIGSQDFTMEMWIYFTTSSRGTGGNYNYGLISLNTITGTSNKVWLTQWIGNANSALWKLNHSFYDGTTLTPPAVYYTPNTWNHICICRQGNNMYSGTNGVVSLTNTTSFNLTTISTNGTRLGTDANYECQYGAYFDDIRITVGFARYTSNYPVPEKQLPIPTRPNN
jgi:hypothetical protein